MFFWRHLLALLLLVASAPAAAEDGYDLWLRYRPVEATSQARYAPHTTSILAQGSSPTLDAARNELDRGIRSMLGRKPASSLRDGAILIGTPAKSLMVRGLRLPLRKAGGEGYLIRSVRTGGKRIIVIAANTDIGVLYGTFAFLRLIQTRQQLARLNVAEAPRLPIRMLNHWDNLDRTVERGYSGPSLWKWDELPDRIDPRYADYARANASIGINAAALTNVNADAQVLTPAYLGKVAALADLFRPYGVRVYLTARFSAPMDIGGLASADPLDPQVRSWWKTKADEIYALIPDFGGFLVKANSEGQPGPQQYGRTHADGANLLADALAPHGGTVFWRAFVYSMANTKDRARQAYEEFKPLDGKFRRNVILQVKNGPIDFQPREPFHPLFGAMPGTRVAMEVQITKEYLGQNTHLAFLAPMWSEVLESRTARPVQNSRVADTISAMAGVANTGSDRNWSGSHFDQANWYAFGRLAWNPALSPGRIAGEWTRMTWGNRPRLAAETTAMMMKSREAVVDYMTPLGLAHLMGTGHHYGPAPWVCDLAQPSWNPCYYHRADKQGIGFDRTPSGSNAVAQYAPPVARQFGSLASVPDAYLLWFHHVPWSYRMRSGRTLWEELVARYDKGVAQVSAMQRQWATLAGSVDRRRHCEVSAGLNTQLREAKWWRDASLAYWQSVNGLPLPAGTAPPDHPLAWYKNLRFDEAPGYLAPKVPRPSTCAE